MENNKETKHQNQKNLKLTNLNTSTTTKEDFMSSTSSKDEIGNHNYYVNLPTWIDMATKITN